MVKKLTQKQFKHSTTSLIAYLEDSNGHSRTTNFLESLELVFRKYHKMDRLYVAFLDVLKTFFGCPTLIHAKDAQIFEKLYNCTVKVVFKSKDMKKLLAGLKVFGNMGSLGSRPEFQKLSKLATSKLASYLVHPFPMVI